MMTGTTETDVSHAPLPPVRSAPLSELAARVPAQAWASIGLVVALLAVLYFRVGVKLVTDWYNIADYSHGFLVPFFSLYLLWDKREKIAATPVRGSWAGIPLVAVGLVLLVFGIYGVDLFTSRFSFIVLISGLVWAFFGWKMLMEVKFPILVLLLAIPFPQIIFNQITFPLQLMASRLAAGILPMLGVPTLQEGNVIQLPAMKLEVAEACSGIRSLMSLFTLAVFYGYFLERTTARRVLLALASIPIAVAANVARIVGTGLCVQYWDPSKAVGFFHEFSGWVMFLVSLCLLYLAHKAIDLLAPAKKEVAV